MVEGCGEVCSKGVPGLLSHVLGWRSGLLYEVLLAVFWLHYLLCCYLCQQCVRLLFVLFDFELFVIGYNWFWILMGPMLCKRIR